MKEMLCNGALFATNATLSHNPAISNLLKQEIIVTKQSPDLCEIQIYIYIKNENEDPREI